MDETDIAYAGVAGQAELVRSGEISSVELTHMLLKRIERLNPAINAFRIVMAEQALAEAAARDQARPGPDDTGAPLHGVPIAIKDEIDVEGQLTTFGTAARTRPAGADAELVARLRAAGAVIVGKTAMPEFGQWPFTESATFGYTRNPWDLGRSTGGSSGGTAAAVAAGLVAAGIGGDGGGSIRIPSACCGLFGLKPTRGLVSAAPLDGVWHALGTLGPLTRSVRDSAVIYDVIRTVWPEHEGDLAVAAASEPGALRIALSRRPTQLGVRLDAEQARALDETAEALRALGHDVREADPDYPELTPAFVPQFYGGVRDEVKLVEAPELLERRTKQTLALARAFPDSAVRWAIGHGEKIAKRVNRLFDDHDVLLTPTIAALPRRIGALDGIGSLHASLRAIPYVAYTAVWNVCGNPGASIPVGFAPDGLPRAVQLVGAPRREPLLLGLAAQLERARPWADQRPPVDPL